MADVSWQELVGGDGQDPSWNDLVKQKPLGPSGSGWDRVSDVGIDVAKGVVGLGESVVGLADLISLGAAGEAMASLGYDPKRTNDILSDLYSKQRKEANLNVENAKGFVDTSIELFSNPSVLAGYITQAIPGTVGIGAAGIPIAERAFRMGKAAATAAGLTGAAVEQAGRAAVEAALPRILWGVSAAEGAQQAGSLAEQARQQGKEWADYVVPAIASGAGTALIARGAGALAPKIGLGGDIEASIAGAVAGGKLATQTGGVVRRAGKGLVREGMLEEMPQSAQEQAWQNVVEGKDLMTDVGGQAAIGLFTGGIMGGGHAVITGERKAEPTPAKEERATETGVQAIFSADTAGEATAVAFEAVSAADLPARTTGMVRSMMGPEEGARIEAQKATREREAAFAGREPAALAAEQEALKQAGTAALDEQGALRRDEQIGGFLYDTYPNLKRPGENRAEYRARLRSMGLIGQAMTEGGENAIPIEGANAGSVQRSLGAGNEGQGEAMGIGNVPPEIAPAAQGEVQGPDTGRNVPVAPALPQPAQAAISPAAIPTPAQAPAASVEAPVVAPTTPAVSPTAQNVGTYTQVPTNRNIPPVIVQPNVTRAELVRRQAVAEKATVVPEKATIPESGTQIPKVSIPATAEKGQIVERFAGQYGKGMSKAGAGQQRADMEKKFPNLIWAVESAPQFGEQRFELVGRKPTEGGQKAAEVKPITEIAVAPKERAGVIPRQTAALPEPSPEQWQGAIQEAQSEWEGADRGRRSYIAQRAGYGKAQFGPSGKTLSMFDWSDMPPEAQRVLGKLALKDMAPKKPRTEAQQANDIRLRARAKARRQVDLNHDSLLAAIAKIGGLKPELKGDVGADKHGNFKVPFVGSLFTENGLGDTSLMADELSALGYFTPEEVESGNAANLLEERIAAELKGTGKYYSLYRDEALSMAEDAKRRDAIEEANFEAAAIPEINNLTGLVEQLSDGEKESFYEQHREASDAEYEAALIQYVKEKRDANQRQNAPDVGTGEEVGEEAPAKPAAEVAPLELTAPTPEELAAQEARAQDQTVEERAIADRERGIFSLQPTAAAPKAEAPKNVQTDMIGTRDLAQQPARKRTAPPPDGLFAAPANSLSAPDLLRAAAAKMEEGAKPAEQPAAQPAPGAVAEQTKVGYNETQADHIYDNAQTRPQTTAEQKSAGVAALKSLFSRDRRAGSTLLGSALWRDFQEHKGADLIGQQAGSAQELALAAQILRDPRFETLRFFFTKGNEIVGHTGVTSRLPGIVSFVAISPQDTKRSGGLVVPFSVAVKKARSDKIAELKAMMGNLGADGYWMLHNHPSGISAPSENDVLMTMAMNEDLKGMKGHIVIDHDQYSVISPNGDEDNIQRLPTSPRHAPELAHDALGKGIQAPLALTQIAKGLESRVGYATAISISAQGRVMALAEIPEHLLSGTTDGAKLKAMARMRRFARMTGSTGVFVFSENPASKDSLIRFGVITDALDYSGSTASSRAAAPGVRTAISTAPKPGVLRAEQMVWHGTPHILAPEPGFPHGRFRLDRVGTGQGAASYGHGIYFGEAEGTGKSYRDQLTGGSRAELNMLTATKDGRSLSGWNLLPEYFKPGRIVRAYAGWDEVIKFNGSPVGQWSVTVKSVKDQFGKPADSYDSRPRTHATSPSSNKVIDVLKKDGWTFETPGSLYRLEIPDDVLPKLLDWDKPLADQDWKVVRELDDAGLIHPSPGGRGWGKIAGRTIPGSGLYHQLVERKGSAKAASEYLASIGIPGSKYLDQGSRVNQRKDMVTSAIKVDAERQAEQWRSDGYEDVRVSQSNGAWHTEGTLPGTRNFVIWDQKVLDRIALLERNGEKLDAMREAELGTFDQNKPNFNAMLTRPDDYADPHEQEAKEVQKAIEGKSIIEVARFIADKAPSADYRLIGKRVMAQLQRLRSIGMKFSFHVSHVGDTVPAALIGTRGMVWREHGSDTSDVWIQGADVTGHIGTSYETVLHELLHAVTQTAIAVGKRNDMAGTKLQQDIINLRRVANHVVLHINKRIVEAGRDESKMTPFERKEFLSRNNAFWDEGEVISWALTNREMQNYLESIPYQGQSLWSRFVQAIRKMLGLESAADTALSEILHIAENITDASVIGDLDRIKAKVLPTQINRAGGLLNNAYDLSQRTPTEAMSIVSDSAFRSAANVFSDFTRSDRVLNRVISKFNTPYHIAESPETRAEFKPVFDEGQASVNDLSRFANEAADQAPDLLPRIEGWKDYGKNSPSTADLNAAADAIYAGTLWAKGNPLDGRVWTDEELKQGRAIDGKVSIPVFKPLNERQIGLYRQNLAAVGQAMRDNAKSRIWRLAGQQDIVLDRAMSLEDMVQIARDATAEKAENLRLAADAARTGPAPDNKRADQIEEQIDQLTGDTGLLATVNDIEKKALGLIEHGYSPLMRFGKYGVLVEKVSKDGKRSTEFFARYETQPEANAAKRELRSEFPNSEISSSAMPDEAYKLFQGLNLDAMQMFADHMIDAEGKPITKNPVMQEYFRIALSERSIMKRHLHRKGTPGYSRDVSRALAQFVVSMATDTSRNYHTTKMMGLVEAIRHGDLKDYATRYVRYLQDPAEESAGLRSFLANYFILGSIAFGAVNMTQPLLMTAPYLSAYTSYGNSLKQIGRAFIEIAKGIKTLTAKELDAFNRAKDEGIVSPQEIHQIRAEGRASMIGDNPLWQKLESVAASRGVKLPGKMLMRKASFLWGSIYSLTEQLNRGTTFIAAYRIAEADAKLGDPYEFASNAVASTQIIYNRANRPEVSRGRIGSVVMTFKQFNIGYIELAKRLYDTDKKAFGILMLTLFALAGAEGLPFAEDVEDLIDTIGQWLGYSTNTKKRLRKLTTRPGGRDIGDVLLHGTSAIPGVPIDIAQRMGMHNIIPGSAILKTSEPDKARDIINILGPAATIFESAGRAVTGLATGQPEQVKLMLPLALQNIAKGAQMVETGQYRDLKGRKVMDVDPADAIFKAVGFQPTKIARETRVVGQNQQDIAMQRVMESSIASQWAHGIADNDKGQIEEARQKLRGWNDKNPELQIRIQPGQIARRVKELRLSREQRFVKAAPREIRQGVVRDIRP